MRLVVLTVFCLLVSGMARAEGEKAGDFDYYVMALSWSPNWCKLEGNAKDSEQCAEDRALGWVLHGLWPQYEQGWPSYCRSPYREATRSETNAMADIMGTSGSAWYQWKKHGRCAGLTAPDYFDSARKAYESVNKPAVLRKLDDTVRLPASVIEEAFLQENPDMQTDMITITCRDGHIQEARICLDKSLSLRACGVDVARDCRAKVLLEPVN